jgi:hypothetical protein
MLKQIQQLFITLGLVFMLNGQAIAWEQHALPTSYIDSSTAHYGGNKAPLVLSSSRIQVATPSSSGITVWNSNNDGVDWSATSIPHTQHFSNVYLANPSLALGWGETQVPIMFHLSVSSGSWRASPSIWPLANWNIMDVNTSTAGDIIILATTPHENKRVEGELFIIHGNKNGWQQPVRLTEVGQSVGDAKFIKHSSGLQSIIWSERRANIWQIKLRNSYDGVTWSSPLTIVKHIAAPYFQEAAVQIAADALNEDEIALAFTGWHMQAHSQVWSKAIDAQTGATTQALALLPDAGDMVHQPSLSVLSQNTWAVAWQQTIGVDAEIYVAQHHADGTWSDAINVSADALHMDRDPHIAKGSSHTLNIAYTRRIQADIQEVYMFSEGDVSDPSLDADGDGIANSQEQGFDWDHDGIDDAFSARVATWQAEDGRYALIVEGNGELRRVQAPSLLNANIQQPTTHNIAGGLFSFQIQSLNYGETTHIHVITPNLLDENVTWLKLNPNAQWIDSKKDHVWLDETGKGLIIALTDGGAGDEDGMSNGVIVDPAVLASPKTKTSPSLNNSKASSQAEQACLAQTNNNPWMAAMLILLYLGIAIAKQKKNA